MRKGLTFLLLALIALPTLAQIPTPGREQTDKILLLGATAHLGNGQVIANSAIAFEKGKLTIVGDASTMRLDINYFDQVHQLNGKHIYPGFIAPNSRLGLFEIGAVRASLDQDDIGEFLPHIRSIIAYNTDSKIIPTVRTNGVLLAQVTPKGGVISGSSSVVHLDAWNWEDAVVRMDDGIHLNWPKMFQRSGWWGEPGPTKASDSTEVRIARINAFFARARAYAENPEPEAVNLRMEAMRGLFSGEKTLYIHANFARDIIRAVNLKRQFEIPKMVLVGGYDAHLLVDLLKENKVSVMLRRVHDLPLRPEDDTDLPYKLPALLAKAGITVCLENSGDMEAMNTRNLPFYAGTATAYGLDKEEALKLISSNTATILGIDDRVGTLEKGKDATLFISAGDAFDMRTNQVEKAFIEGRELDLNNHQKELYEKFRAKYPVRGESDGQ